MLASAEAMPPDLRSVVERATHLLDAIFVPTDDTAMTPVPVAPSSLALVVPPRADVVAVDAVLADDAPESPPFVPARSRASVAPRVTPDAATLRPSIRVNLDRLDVLMNLVGELAISRSRLERRLAQFERVGALLGGSQSRMSRVVRDFEEKYFDPRIPEHRDLGLSASSHYGVRDERFLGPALSDAESFSVLELDRYDD